jgi:HSP20 family protein
MEVVMNLRSLIPFGRGRGLARRETDPFTAMQWEIDRLFGDFARDAYDWPNYPTRELTPRMDVAESDKVIEITAELPGLEEKDVEVTFSDGVLTVSGEKKAEKEEKDKSYRLFERSYGSFSRSVELPDGVDADAITASISNGLLKVTVPKPAPAEAEESHDQIRCLMGRRRFP